MAGAAVTLTATEDWFDARVELAGWDVIFGRHTCTVAVLLSAVQVPSLARTQYCVVLAGTTAMDCGPEVQRCEVSPLTPVYHVYWICVPRAFVAPAVRIACELRICVTGVADTLRRQTVTVARRLSVVQRPLYTRTRYVVSSLRVPVMYEAVVAPPIGVPSPRSH